MRPLPMRRNGNSPALQESAYIRDAIFRTKITDLICTISPVPYGIGGNPRIQRMFVAAMAIPAGIVTFSDLMPREILTKSALIPS